jgi:hypothetical protein
MPQARFWIAIAMPQVSRDRPRSLVMGRVKRPKLVRMPLVTAAMTQPAIISRSRGVALERAVPAIEDIWWLPGGQGV